MFQGTFFMIFKIYKAANASNKNARIEGFFGFNFPSVKC